MKEEMQKTEKSIENLESPIDICRNCQNIRKNRLKEDLVEDEVDRKLSNELNILLKSEKELDNLKIQLIEQIRLINKNIQRLRK